jgi:hypothetical protein
LAGSSLDEGRRRALDAPAAIPNDQAMLTMFEENTSGMWQARWSQTAIANHLI